MYFSSIVPETHCQRFYHKEMRTSQYTYKYVWEQGSG